MCRRAIQPADALVGWISGQTPDVPDGTFHKTTKYVSYKGFRISEIRPPCSVARVGWLEEGSFAIIKANSLFAIEKIYTK